MPAAGATTPSSSTRSPSCAAGARRSSACAAAPSCSPRPACSTGAGPRRTGPGRERLAAEHPAVDVDADPIWTRDGNVWTSAGVTAGIDVALALVEDDHGVEVAETCARWLVMFLRRPAARASSPRRCGAQRARDEPIRRAQELIEADPGADHRLACSPAGSR